MFVLKNKSKEYSKYYCEKINGIKYPDRKRIANIFSYTKFISKQKGKNIFASIVLNRYYYITFWYLMNVIASHKLINIYIFILPTNIF